jgi:hypothetical protein
MLYRLNFAADPPEPMPPVDTLVAVEAPDPMAAVEQALAAGLVPQDRLYKWARVVLTAENRHAARVLRVPINADLGPALDWGPGDEIVF